MTAHPQAAAPCRQAGALSRASHLAPSRSRSPLLQRKCGCGGTPGLTGGCEQCRARRSARLAGRPEFAINRGAYAGHFEPGGDA
jgi:hypothetical protein